MRSTPPTANTQPPPPGRQKPPPHVASPAPRASSPQQEPPIPQAAPELQLEPDEDLVRRSRRGDRDAFSRLVARYERPALLVAASVLHSWHDARDAVQDAFVTAYQHLNRLWSPHKFGPWFLRIARRQALWHRRRRQTRTRHLAPLLADPAVRPAPAPDVPDDLLSLIARLPEQECAVVSLRHLDDLPVAEIARITGRPVGTVTKQLSRAYARMRPWIGEQD